MTDNNNTTGNLQSTLTRTILEEPKTDLKKQKADQIKAGLFFTLVTSFGLLSGFGLSFSSTKKEKLNSWETKN